MKDGLVYIEGKYIALNGHFQPVTERVTELYVKSSQKAI